MTDNEIIKALDICGHLEACADCPLGCLEGVDKCMHTLLLNALDLINRKNAEIESRDKRESYLFRKIHERDSEIEKWKAECENQSVLWRDHFESIFESAKETVRAKAIKEFAERVKDKVDDPWLYNGSFIDSIIDEVDDLVKEMTEEKK